MRARRRDAPDGFEAAGAVGSTAGHAEPRSPVLVGANPGIQLFDSTGASTAVLSTWIVDWSIHGSGTALVLWRPGEVRATGENEDLTRWLVDGFVRHFPELGGLPWNDPVFEHSPVRVRLDLERGMWASGSDVTAHMSHVLDRRAFTSDAFALGGVLHTLSLILAPCASASVRVAGEPLPGGITLAGTAQRPSSTAFLAAAEVWQR